MRRFLCTTLLALSLASPAFATLSSTMVWEIRQTATAGGVNGGGYNASGSNPGIDYSQQDAAQFNLTLVTTAGADNVILTAAAVTNMNRNIAHVISGTSFTAGWYEITNVTPGVSIELDRACATGAGSGGVVNIGGAMSLNSTLDSELFSSFVAGNSVWQKAGTYVTVEPITGTGGSTTSNIKWRGYNTTRGDAPTGSNRPTINVSAQTFIIGASWTISDLIIAGTTATTQVLIVGTDSRIRNCKITCSSTVAGKNAVTLAAGCATFNCEFVSQNGRAIDCGGASDILIYGTYLHDSDIGVNGSAGSGITVVNCLFEDCKTAGFTISATAARSWILNSTFHGGIATPKGIGVRSTGAAATSLRIYGNIFNGLTTGIEIATAAQDSIVENYNDFFNCTTPRTLIATGENSITTNPAFSGVTQITGSTASTATVTLTQSGGDFSSVTDNVDYVRVETGTSVTPGIYLITGHSGTTLSVNNSMGTSGAADVTYVIYTGHNFGITASLPGFPGAFNSNASETTGFMQMGAVQKVSSGGGGGSSAFVFP